MKVLFLFSSNNLHNKSMNYGDNDIHSSPVLSVV
jgi:hypothetical protein